MTRTFYERVLCFYPAAYRNTFGKEMAETYDRAAEQHRTRGAVAAALFSLRELSGLAAGVFSEWTAKCVAPETYVTSRCHVRTESGLPSEIVELQGELERLIRSMEFAIAHHDFPKARLYSQEEQVARRKLERLMAEQGVQNDPALA